mgnify:CR=1 FL=1
MNAVTEGRKVLLEIADLKVHFEIKMANSVLATAEKRSKPSMV